MDCSTAKTIVGISPLVNGVELTDEEAALDVADLLFLLPPVAWLVRVRLFTFLVASSESLIVSSTLAFVCQECAHAQALNRYIALASVSTLTWFKSV